MTETNIDTRTFREIYNSLNEVERYELRGKIMSLSYCGESAIYNWIRGGRHPQAVHQQNVVKALRSFGINAKTKFLFPSK